VSHVLCIQDAGRVGSVACDRNELALRSADTCHGRSNGPLTMYLTISQTDTSIVFRFGDRATPVSGLIVADESEDILWEIESGPVLEAVPVPEHRFDAVEVPSEVAALWNAALPEDNPDQYLHVTQITYGELPEGFREVEPASQLTRGKTYCVTSFGAGLDSAGQFFTA